MLLPTPGIFDHPALASAGPSPVTCSPAAKPRHRGDTPSARAVFIFAQAKYIAKAPKPCYPHRALFAVLRRAARLPCHRFCAILSLVAPFPRGTKGPQPPVFSCGPLLFALFASHKKKTAAAVSPIAPATPSPHPGDDPPLALTQRPARRRCTLSRCTLAQQEAPPKMALPQSFMLSSALTRTHSSFRTRKSTPYLLHRWRIAAVTISSG